MKSAGFVALLVVWAGALLAGECLDGNEAYLEVIEGRRELPYYGFWGAADCLRCDFDISTNRWAGPKTAEHLRRCREDSLRPRIAAAFAPYLKLNASNDSLAALRERAAVVLASYGFTEVDSIDVYEIIESRAGASRNGLQFNTPLLAAMDDPRTLPFLAATYDSLRAIGVKRHREDLIAILNCAYHLSDPEAAAFAARFAKSETDTLLVARAKLVTDRR